MKHETILLFTLPPDTATAIAAALAPEASQTEVPKTRGDVSAEGTSLRVAITAQDIPSLRAAVNSHLRWIDAAQRAAHVARDG